MFVTDVKCSQATRQIIPNSRTGSSKASVSEAVVRTCTWHRTHVVKGRPNNQSNVRPCIMPTRGLHTYYKIALL